MKLMISFDITDLRSALSTARQVAPFCDIIEVGTVLLYKYGIEALKSFKKELPDKTILADSKIIDRGKTATTLLAQAGADWVSVMSGTSNTVIHSVCTTAHNEGSKVMLDLLDAPSPGQSAMEAKNLGIDALLFHPSHEESDQLAFLDQWDMVSGNTELPIFISAKIKRETVEDIIKFKPTGIVIGTSVVTAKNPAEEAEFFYEIINR